MFCGFYSMLFWDCRQKLFAFPEEEVTRCLAGGGEGVTRGWALGGSEGAFGEGVGASSRLHNVFLRDVATGVLDLYSSVVLRRGGELPIPTSVPCYSRPRDCSEKSPTWTWCSSPLPRWRCNGYMALPRIRWLTLRTGLLPCQPSSRCLPRCL